MTKKEFRSNLKEILVNFSRFEADMEFGKEFDIRHSREMFQSLNKMRENRSYTDVTLSVKGEVFHAHKLILAASSRYFDAMFSAGMKESSQTEVEIKGDYLTVEAFRLLLDFIYTSILPLTEVNVLDVLEAADQLEILSVVEKCSLFIVHNLTRDKFHLETRLKIYRVADRHNLTELREQSLRALALRFGVICEEKGFMENITADELLLLLSRNDLSVPSETFLFTTVIAWIKYDQDERLSEAPRVLDKVRLALVDIMVVLAELECEEFQEIPECFSLMYKCLLQHVRPFLFSPFAEDKGMPRVESKASTTVPVSLCSTPTTPSAVLD